MLSKLRTYLSNITFLSGCMLSVKKRLLVYLFLSGMISSVFYLLAFVLSIKLISTPEVFSLFVAVDDVQALGFTFVFITLLLWVVGTNVYRVGLVRLERAVSREVLVRVVGCQGRGCRPFSECVSVYPKVLARGARSLFVCFLTMPILFLVLCALFYIDSIFTFAILLLLFIVICCLPFIQRDTRSLKAHHLDMVKMDAGSVRGMSAKFVGGEQGVAVDDFTRTHELVDLSSLSLVKGEERVTLLVNSFSALTIAALVGWFVFDGGGIDLERVPQLLIYLILVRFFSSYCSSLMRQLSILNSDLHSYNEVRNYIYSAAERVSR